MVRSVSCRPRRSSGSSSDRAIAASAIPTVDLRVGHETDLNIADWWPISGRRPLGGRPRWWCNRSRRLLERLGSQRARCAVGGRLAVARRRGRAGRLESARVLRRRARPASRAMLRLDDLERGQRLCVERRLTGARHQLEVLEQRMTSPAPVRSLRGPAGRSRRTAAYALRRGGTPGRARDAVAAFGERLHALSPLAVLSRG